MDDTISRKAALDALKNSRFPGAPHVDAGISIAIGVICDLPPIDAVPVVRCGECKYMMPDGHCTMFADDRIRPSSSDFCSAGERKDGDGNG